MPSDVRWLCTTYGRRAHATTQRQGYLWAWAKCSVWLNEAKPVPDDMPRCRHCLARMEADDAR